MTLPTDALCALFDATQPLLLALKSVVEAQAAKHPDSRVPSTTLDEALAILTAARRIFSREPVLPVLFVLRGDCTWAALASKLAVTAAAFAAFKARHRDFDEDLDEHIWLTSEWRDSFRSAQKFALPASDLDDAAEDLSPLV